MIAYLRPALQSYPPSIRLYKYNLEKIQGPRSSKTNPRSKHISGDLQ